MEFHPSAEEVFQAVKEKIPTISFDTVYRTLALYERHGVISRVQYLDTRTRYDSNIKTHYHLVCKKCGSIEDFYWSALENLELPWATVKWGNIDNRYLELRGICNHCLKDSEKK